VHLLLELGASPSAADASGHMAIVLAAASGSVETVTLLLEQGRSPVDSQQGISPLEAAAGAGHLEVVRLLLEHGANADAQNTKPGRTALHACARAGHIGVARLLVDKGGNLLLRDRTDRMAHEHLPDAVLATPEGKWLAHAAKAAKGSKASKPKAATEEGEPQCEEKA
jgi:ankyrin repeat protein